MSVQTLTRRTTAEAIGTAMLLAAVVGSGIMGQRLASGNVALALLANTLATGAALVALIFTFGSISGAHFNPAVTLSVAWNRDLRWHDVPGYIIAQLIGAFAGVAIAHLMFGLPVFFHIASQSRWRGSITWRVCCHVRTTGDYLGLFEIPSASGSLCRGRFYHGGLLVYVVNVLC